MKLALFDLDHTLIPFDSDYEWGEFTIALGWCDGHEFKRRNAEFLRITRPAPSMCTTMCVLPPRPSGSKALQNQ